MHKFGIECAIDDESYLIRIIIIVSVISGSIFPFVCLLERVSEDKMLQSVSAHLMTEQHWQPDSRKHSTFTINEGLLTPKQKRSQPENGSTWSLVSRHKVTSNFLLNNNIFKYEIVHRILLN